MKNLLFTVLFTIGVLATSSVLLAQTEDDDTIAETEDIRRKVRRRVSPNRPAGQTEEARQQNRERALTAREKRRERMVKMREARVKQLQEAGRARAAQQGREAVAKGVDHEKQLKQLETQINHEKAKHDKRIARLNRIKGLAEQEGSEEVLARVEKLLQKEQRRYSFKRQRMDMKMRTFKRIRGRQESLARPAETSETPGVPGYGGRRPRAPGPRPPGGSRRQRPDEEPEQ
ncbi:MAG: hypothetical protein ACYS4W_10400 [Planctomycetota bacterium]|jgi:hypothetical protein